jgi:ribonuclease J
MKIIIHRAAGGSCVELEAGGSRILIDPVMSLLDREGRKLDAGLMSGRSSEDLVKEGLLPDIEGVYRHQKKGVDAVLISSLRAGHYGYLSRLHQDIPVYMTRGAKELINISNIFDVHNSGALKISILNKKKVLKCGAFFIQTYNVDRSAYDAAAFLIESGNRRLFYSGDVRGHGRKSMLYKKIIKDPPPDIDCLLMGGSAFVNGEKINESGKVLRKKTEDILRESDNITFLFADPNNIDRITDAYKACINTGSILVIDIYTAFILDKLRKVSKNIPQFDRENMRIKFSKEPAHKLSETGYRELLFSYNKRKIDMFALNRKKNKILLVVRDDPMFPNIVKKIEGVKGAKLIYSTETGYLTDKFRDYCRRKGIVIEEANISGNACCEALKVFVKSLDPGVLVPVNNIHPEKYTEAFENLHLLPEGEELEV